MFMQFHKRICQGLDSIGELVPVGANPYTYINPAKDAYISIYDYTDQHLAKFNEVVEKINEKTGKPYKSKRGCSGITDVTTNWFVFDFDYADKKGTSLEDARREAVQLCDKLQLLGFKSEDYLITFSGNKGFGVEFRTKERYTPEQVKEIAKYVRGESKTWDSVVYNANRIMRLPFTRHQSSGLFKIPLNYEELKTESLDNIKSWAAGNYEASVIPLPEVSTPEDFKKALIKHEKPKTTAIAGEKPDLSGKPRWMSNFKYALQQGFFPPGARNNALMVLAATYRSHGWLKEHTFNILKGVAEVQAKRYTQDKYSDEKIWKEIIQTVYSDLWVGGTYAEDKLPLEITEHLEGLGVGREKPSETNLVPVDDIYSTFEDFAVNIEKNTIKTGISGLDNLCRITTSMLVGLLGSPGSGKSSAVLSILNQHSNDGEASVFFSLDMGKPLIYQKMAQKFTGYSSDEIFRIFQEREEAEKQKIREKIQKEYKNVQICFRTGATVRDLKNYILDYEHTSGRKVRLVAVDYLEKVVGPFSDATANSAKVAAELQELANDLECCVLLLLQPQKIAGDPSEPLRTYRRVKGASVIEQDCRVVISLFREGYEPQSHHKDKFITFAVLKNTMGELGEIDCYWNGLRGEVTEIDDIGREELAQIRRERKEKKAKESFL